MSGTSRYGTTHHYYRCGNTIHKKSCGKKTVHKDWIERHVVTLTQQHILNDSVIDHLATAVVELQKRENTTIPFLQKQLTDIEKRIGHLLNAIEEGIINASTKQRLDDLEARKDEVEISIAKEKIAQTPLTKEQVMFWISRFKDGDINDATYRRSIVDIFINSIFLYDDKLVITFNYKDGSRTVTLEKLEDAAGDSLSEKASSSNGLDGSHLNDCPPPPPKPPTRKG